VCVCARACAVWLRDAHTRGFRWFVRVLCGCGFCCSIPVALCCCCCCRRRRRPFDGIDFKTHHTRARRHCIHLVVCVCVCVQTLLQLCAVPQQTTEALTVPVFSSLDTALKRAISFSPSDGITKGLFDDAIGCATTVVCVCVCV